MRCPISTKSLFGYGLFLLILSSCVRDVDFKQGEDFRILQDNTVSLVFFNLGTQDFNGSIPSVATVRRDTTRLGFLDDQFIQEGLVGLEFLFRLENSFTQDFNVQVEFLSPSDEVNYSFEFPVESGTPANPQVTTVVEPISNENLQAIKNAIKMAVEIELQANEQPVEGNLDFMSRADFVLEIGG